MKNSLRLLSLLFILPFMTTAQTIVDTEPQNKNVVLEQFTGINCPWCPQGSAIADNIYNANPDRVVVIAVHVGGFANPSGSQPDFRTPWGPSLVGQTGLTGYPGGTVNRQVFPGWEMTSGQTAMSRGNWTAASNVVLEQSAYVNVGAEAVIDLETREITVHVETYYTGNSPANTNKLNVALLQDKTYAYQAGGSSNYEHNNRLVHLLTGQWGLDITKTNEGSFRADTLTYTIPEHYNDIPAELENMRVAAFVAESTQEIISGVQVSPSFVNAPDFEYAITDHAISSEVWEGAIEPVIQVKNNGEEITSLEFEYSINGGEAHTYTWAGSLTFGESGWITLPEVSFDVLPENTITIQGLDEDSSPEDNHISAEFSWSEATGNTNLLVELKTDQYGSEITWEIKNAEDNTLVSGGPYPNQMNTYTYDVELPKDYYTLIIYDAYGDGILAGGYIRVKDGEQTIVNIAGNSYEDMGQVKFRVVDPVVVSFDPEDGAVDVEADASFTVTADKDLYTLSFDLLTEENYDGHIVLREDDQDGDDIPFSVTITNHHIITIEPLETLENEQAVYLAIDVRDHDYVHVIHDVTFTIEAEEDTDDPTNVDMLSSYGIAMYPNPASDNIYLQLPEIIAAADVRIFNTSGQQIFFMPEADNGHAIDIRSWEAGLYFVQITADGYRVQKKLMIAR